jgi:hypothetical protein
MSYAQLSQRVISFDQLAKIKIRYVQPAQIQVDQIAAFGRDLERKGFK